MKVFILLYLLTMHKHVVDVSEKCNRPGCGGWCKCKYFREDSTGKWFPSKDSAIKYLHKVGNPTPPLP
jgi:hypothetical protein